MPCERITVGRMTYGDLFGSSDSDEDEGPSPSSGSLQRSPSQNQNQASRLKELNPNCLTHLGSQMAGQFLNNSTGMEFTLFAVRKVLKDPQTLRQNSGITTRSNSASRTLPDGNVKSSYMRNVCPGNKGTLHQPCP